MRMFILIIILVTLQNAAKASESTVTVIRKDFSDTVLTVMELATPKELSDLRECNAESDSSDNSCINEVFGDIYN